MNRSIAFLLGLCVASAFARGDLTIRERIEGAPGAKAPGEITMRIKEERVRIDMPPSLSTILDLSTGDIVALRHQRKLLMRMKAPPPSAAPSGEGTGAMVLTPTGRKETISGFECEEYTSTRDGRQTNYWVAPGFPDYAAVMRKMQAIQQATFGKASQQMKMFDPAQFKGYPIRSEMVLSDIVRIVTTVVHVSQDPIDDSVFAIPADYKEVAIQRVPAAKPQGGGGAEPESKP